MRINGSKIVIELDDYFPQIKEKIEELCFKKRKTLNISEIIIERPLFQRINGIPVSCETQFMNVKKKRVE